MAFMKKNLFKGSVILLSVAALLSFGACHKKTSDAAVPANDNSAEGTTAQDQNNVTNASNQMSEEADVVASGSSSNARVSSNGGTILPGVLRIDSMTPGTYKITYDGIHKSASGIIRKGTDSIIINGQWHLAGSFIVSYYDYTILNINNGKTLHLQGIDTIKKISNGNYYDLLKGTTITVMHTGTAQITFDDGTVRTWNHSREKVRSFANGIITSTITGTGMPNSISNVEAWGINRRGEHFYGQISSPLIWSYYADPSSNTCMHWAKPISGVYFHKGSGAGLTVTYGVNSSGVANAMPFDTCPYGYKLDWTFSNKSLELIVSY
jgi:hypothetical protein